jgi:hypothetical protein
MAGSRLKEAMADLAETIRRVFKAPPAHGVPVSWAVPMPGQIPPLGVATGLAFDPCVATALQEDLLVPVPPVTAELTFSHAVAGEPGLATWEAGAKICALPLFQAERCARLVVPPLPRRVPARQEKAGGMATRSRNGWETFPPPGVRRQLSGFAPPGTYLGLERVLAMPVAVLGEDLSRVSKALWMRYTLQLVRATGENIRNLDVIGLYRIPTKGTRQLHHDPATGRLMVSLGPEARGAKRALFILARRKTDATIVFCFVEGA